MLMNVVSPSGVSLALPALQPETTENVCVSHCWTAVDSSLQSHSPWGCPHASATESRTLSAMTVCMLSAVDLAHGARSEERWRPDSILSLCSTTSQHKRTSTTSSSSCIIFITTCHCLLHHPCLCSDHYRVSHKERLACSMGQIWSFDLVFLPHALIWGQFSLGHCGMSSKYCWCSALIQGVL